MAVYATEAPRMPSEAARMGTGAVAARDVADRRPAPPARATVDAPPSGAGPDALLVANDQLARILARSCRVRRMLARQVVDGSDVVLDKDSPPDLRASVAYDWIEHHSGGRAPFSFELCKQVMDDEKLRHAVDGSLQLSRRDYGLLVARKAMAYLLATHEAFLRSFDPLATDPTFKALPLSEHKHAAGLPHYAALDHLFGRAEIIWRFTSKPAEERLFVKANTPARTIVERIAEHSGGNNKSSADVQTLSFGRNPAALFGTAMSSGGDPNVLDIINKADYLYGIDISTLAARGISAHPATGRAISLFESEYVLLGTPGEPPWSLEEIATHRYRNPFKREAAAFAKEHGFKKDLVPTVPIDPSSLLVTTELPGATIEAIFAQALKVASSARQFQPTIQYRGNILKEDSEYDAASVFNDVQKFAAMVLDEQSAHRGARTAAK